MAQAPKKTIQVKLRSPYQNYFAGAALSVSARNRLGNFDVLPDHTPFFSLLLPGIVTVRTNVETLQFRIQNGVLKVKNNQVEVFLNI